MITFITFNEHGKPLLTQQGAVIIILLGLSIGLALVSCSESMLKRRPRLRAE